jgi:hypothetical protein
LFRILGTVFLQCRNHRRPFVNFKMSVLKAHLHVVIL